MKKKKIKTIKEIFDKEKVLFSKAIFGWLITLTHPDNEVYTYTYNVYNQINTITSLSGIETHSYDQNQLLSIIKNIYPHNPKLPTITQ